MVSGLTPEGAGTGNPIMRCRNRDSWPRWTNWVNGVDLASQKAIAKSLIKLHLSEGNAAAVRDQGQRGSGRAGRGGRQHRHRNGLSQPQGDAYSAST